MRPSDVVNVLEVKRARLPSNKQHLRSCLYDPTRRTHDVTNPNMADTVGAPTVIAIMVPSSLYMYIYIYTYTYFEYLKKTSTCDWQLSKPL